MPRLKSTSAIATTPTQNTVRRATNVAARSTIGLSSPITTITAVNATIPTSAPPRNNIRAEPAPAPSRGRERHLAAGAAPFQPTADSDTADATP